MTTWCQNIKCADKKNQNQIRGNKGSKYYQSNKANKYYDHWCSESCRKQWFSDHATVCLNAVGEIDRQVVPLEDAWYVEYRYDWRSEIQDRYHLVNRLKGVDHSITREQAQTQEQIDADHSWRTITDAQARELAVSLGLVS